jgi:hypothetical protein
MQVQIVEFSIYCPIPRINMQHIWNFVFFCEVLALQNILTKKKEYAALPHFNV